jgi:hypothetical protein
VYVRWRQQVSPVTLIPLIQTTRLHSLDYAPPPTKISYGIIISTVLFHAWNQTWRLSLTWLINWTVGLKVQIYSRSFAYGNSWRQTALGESKLKVTTTSLWHRVALQILHSVFLSYSVLFLPAIFGVEGFSYTWSHSITHTHTFGTPSGRGIGL